MPVKNCWEIIFALLLLKLCLDLTLLYMWRQNNIRMVLYITIQQTNCNIFMYTCDFHLIFKYVFFMVSRRTEPIPFGGKS